MRVFRWAHRGPNSKKVSEYDQVIPQSHTADQPTDSEEEPQNSKNHTHQ